MSEEQDRISAFGTAVSSFLRLTGAAAASSIFRFHIRFGSGVVFHEQNADIWGWQTEVEGRSAARITVNGIDVPVELNSGWFRAHIKLQPGINKVEGYDVVGQSSLLTLTCRLSANPTAATSVSQGADVVRFSSSPSFSNPSTQAPLVEFVWARDGVFLEEAPELRIHPPWIDGEHIVDLSVSDAQGRTGTAGAVYVVEAGVPIIPDLATWHPGWIDQAIIYGVVPPLFGNQSTTSR